MLNNYPDVMTPEQVATALCISRKSVYRLLRERTIGSKRIGKKYIIPKRCVVDYRFSQLHSQTITAGHCQKGINYDRTSANQT